MAETQNRQLSRLLLVALAWQVEQVVRAKYPDSDPARLARVQARITTLPRVGLEDEDLVQEQSVVDLAAEEDADPEANPDLPPDDGISMFLTGLYLLPDTEELASKDPMITEAAWKHYLLLAREEDSCWNP